MSCRILVLQPEIESKSPALGVQSLSHGNIREVTKGSIFKMVPSISLNTHTADIGHFCHFCFLISLTRNYPSSQSFQRTGFWFHFFFSVGFPPLNAIDFYSYLYYFLLFLYFGFKFLKIDA